MNNIDIAIALLCEAAEQKKSVEEHERDYKEFLKSSNYGDADKMHEFCRKWPTTPCKSVVNDNIKMARRLLLKEYIR